MDSTYTVKVALRTGKREVESPSYDSKEEAAHALRTISKAAQTGAWIDLDWLGINGGEVLSAHIEEHYPPFVA